MARARNHKAEYAALKARAEAVGLSARAYRRERQADPARYYAPRAQVTLNKRATLAFRIAEANRARGASFPDMESRAFTRIEQSTPKQRSALTAILDDHEDSGFDSEFWDDIYDSDDDVDPLLYYRE